MSFKYFKKQLAIIILASHIVHISHYNNNNNNNIIALSKAMAARQYKLNVQIILNSIFSVAKIPF